MPWRPPDDEIRLDDATSRHVRDAVSVLTPSRGSTQFGVQSKIG